MTLSELIRRTNHPDGPVICLDVATVRVLVEAVRLCRLGHIPMKERIRGFEMLEKVFDDLDLSTIELPPAAEGSA